MPDERSSPTSSVGYEVKITRRDDYGGRDWHVQVKRLSDDMEIVRIFAWRWRARRFARSTTRLGRAFARSARYRDGEIETFTLGWPS